MPTNADKMPQQEEKESLQQANSFANGNAEKVTFKRQSVIIVTSYRIYFFYFIFGLGSSFRLL